MSKSPFTRNLEAATTDVDQQVKEDSPDLVNPSLPVEDTPNYYINVKRWLNKIDLFSYNSVIIPINEAYHWYGCIIVGLPDFLEKAKKRKNRREEQQRLAEEEEAAAAATQAEANGDADIEVQGRDSNGGTNGFDTNGVDTNGVDANAVANNLVNKSGVDTETTDTDDTDSNGAIPNNSTSTKLNANDTRNGKLTKENTPTTNTANDSYGKEEILRDMSSSPIDLALINIDELEATEAKQPITLKYPDKINIFVFDSLSQKHLALNKPIKSFLIGYCMDKHGIEITSQDIVFRSTKVPKQNNFNDCGIHVIYNIRKFLNNRYECLRIWDQNKSNYKSFFAASERSKVREELIEQLLDLHSKQPAPKIEEKKVDDVEESDEEIQLLDIKKIASPVTISREQGRGRGRKKINVTINTSHFGTIQDKIAKADNVDTTQNTKSQDNIELSISSNKDINKINEIVNDLDNIRGLDKRMSNMNVQSRKPTENNVLANNLPRQNILNTEALRPSYRRGMQIISEAPDRVSDRTIDKVPDKIANGGHANDEVEKKEEANKKEEKEEENQTIIVNDNEEEEITSPEFEIIDTKHYILDLFRNTPYALLNNKILCRNRSINADLSKVSASILNNLFHETATFSNEQLAMIRNFKNDINDLNINLHLEELTTKLTWFKKTYESLRESIKRPKDQDFRIVHPQSSIITAVSQTNEIEYSSDLSAYESPSPRVEETFKQSLCQLNPQLSPTPAQVSFDDKIKKQNSKLTPISSGSRSGRGRRPDKRRRKN